MYLLFREILIFVFSLSAVTTDIEEPCVSYKELRDSHRSQFHQILPLGFAHCDKQLETGWYRFQGKAGVKMPEKCVTPGYCGTHAPGWFKGSHPKVVGAVSSGKACFNWFGSCCHWVTSVRVKKCDGFYVYQLPQTPLCDLQYCGDGAADPECTADNNNVAINGSVPGFLTSPQFSDRYPKSLQCTWRITVSPGMKVRLTLENMTFGSNDYIVLLDGLQDNSKELAKYDGGASGVIRLDSTDRYMLVKFVSNGSNISSDFRLEYKSVSSETNQKTTTSSQPSTVTTIKPETMGETTTISQPATVTKGKQETMGETTTISQPATVTKGKQDDYIMDVTCSKDEIKVILHLRSKLDYVPESVGLNHASCKPSFQNSTHIFVKSTLEDCGTTSDKSKDGSMIVYHNAIHLDVKTKKLIGSFFTRDHQAVFEFQCRYKKRAVLSVISFDPSKVLIVTDMESFGNFTFEMKMFKSGLFREHYTDYPVGPIDVGSPIFLQVSVRSNDSGLVVLVEECKATPSSAFDDDVHYTFIEDGCSKDSTLEYNHTLSAVQRFSLHAFSFRFEKSNEIFLHCRVKACLRSDATSRCSKGCPYDKRKKRESLREVDRFLAIGPIVLSPEQGQSIKKTEHQTSTDDDDTVAFAVVTGVLVFIVLLLVAALLSICKSRGTPESNGANVILVREDEPEYG